MEPRGQAGSEQRGLRLQETRELCLFSSSSLATRGMLMRKMKTEAVEKQIHGLVSSILEEDLENGFGR